MANGVYGTGRPTVGDGAGRTGIAASDGSGAFTATAADTFGFLVVDEAHRLNEKSGIFSHMGEHQVKELVNAARCCIFFLDEDQRIAMDDVGSLALIEHFAAQRGATVERYSLASQFRCAGSDGYLAWLDCRALGLGDDPADAFLKRGRVALSSGPTFGSEGKGFARLNFATTAALLEEGVLRMKRAL